MSIKCCSPYTLQYLNNMGDIITRDYFDNEVDARNMALSLLNTYKENGSETVCGLCIEDAQGNEIVTYDVKPNLDNVIRLCEDVNKNGAVKSDKNEIDYER